ncbi:ArsC/Spx/MgsR family protein [Thermaurantimonas sp.]|uniref:ArsC/Spx/MgsR family protein n=1 Tax=Thermaurantimonas sp. TaxID=2681568 RepID=UPI003918E31E
MLIVYHNPRCAKSREAIKWLEERNIPFQIKRYLDEPLTFEEVEKLVELAGFHTIDIMRTNEQVWKKKYAELELDDNELIYAIIEDPILMQRPIVYNPEKDLAVIARPADKIQEIL